MCGGREKGIDGRRYCLYRKGAYFEHVHRELRMYVYTFEAGKRYDYWHYYHNMNCGVWGIITQHSSSQRKALMEGFERRQLEWARRDFLSSDHKWRSESESG